MTETRKLAAILVADVVGYSRLAGADEDRTLSRLRGLQPIKTGRFETGFCAKAGQEHDAKSSGRVRRPPEARLA